MSVPELNPLLALGAVLLVGAAFGRLAKLVRLPSVTGYVVAGVLLGHHGLRLLEEEALSSLEPLTIFALGLMAVTVGAHLNLRRLRNAGKRLFFLLLTEATVTPLVILLVLVFVTKTELHTGALFATLAISTAPATIVAIVKEARARGVFVKTLVAAVALNNMACIFLFEVARAIARVELDPDPTRPHDVLAIILAPSLQLAGALVIGGGAGLVAASYMRRTHSPERLGTAAFLAILVTAGFSSWLGLSPLLSCTFLGLAQANLVPERERIVDRVFSDFEPAILTVFFTLAGMHLSLEHAGRVGLIAVVFVGTRIFGKIAAAWLAMKMAGAPGRIRRHLGLSLVPQAGVAVGLVILIQSDPGFSAIRDLFVGVVLTSVTINEIVGPILTKWALGLSGEVGRDRPRLIDFIGEQNIVIDLEAQSMEEAIEQLTDLLVETHHLTEVDRNDLLTSILEREAQSSTCLGGGLAIPHGELHHGERMVGVLGISTEGLDLDAPDGRPVHFVVLLATPDEERDRHLQVLAGLARAMGTDPVMRRRLLEARSAAHAYEILHDDAAAEDFNYFLEE